MDKLPIQLSASSGVPFYRQILDQIAELVRSGQLGPGTRLPSFRDLAAQLLVSLITVRRAYADLEAAGLIALRQGQGTFVADRVKPASRAHAQAEARKVLAQAISRARRLGLTASAIRTHVEELLPQEEESSHE